MKLLFLTCSWQTESSTGIHYIERWNLNEEAKKISISKNNIRYRLIKFSVTDRLKYKHVHELLRKHSFISAQRKQEISTYICLNLTFGTRFLKKKFVNVLFPPLPLKYDSTCFSLLTIPSSTMFVTQETVSTCVAIALIKIISKKC